MTIATLSAPWRPSEGAVIDATDRVVFEVAERASFSAEDRAALATIAANVPAMLFALREFAAWPAQHRQSGLAVAYAFAEQVVEDADRVIAQADALRLDREVEADETAAIRQSEAAEAAVRG